MDHRYTHPHGWDLSKDTPRVGDFVVLVMDCDLDSKEGDVFVLIDDDESQEWVTLGKTIVGKHDGCFEVSRSAIRKLTANDRVTLFDYVDNHGGTVVKLTLDGITHRFGSTYVYQLTMPDRSKQMSQDFLEANLHEDHLAILRHHAKAFACLNGNAFGPLTEYQYIVEAYYNLLSNGALEDIPNFHDHNVYG